MSDHANLGVSMDEAAARWENEYRPILKYVAQRFSEVLPDGLQLELADEEDGRA